jgi:hypothetical protein
LTSKFGKIDFLDDPGGQESSLKDFIRAQKKNPDLIASELQSGPLKIKSILFRL